MFTELVIQEVDSDTNEVRMRYFEVPTEWLEQEIIPDCSYTGLQQFLDYGRNEEMYEVYCRALFEDKIIHSRVEII